MSARHDVQAKEHLARNTLLAAVFELAANHGVPRSLILDEIGLDEATALLPGMFVKSSQLIDAVECAASATACADFGLKLSAMYDHRMIGALGLLMESCGSVHEAADEVSPYFHLQNTALHYTLTRAGDEYVYDVQIKALGAYPPRQYVEYLMSSGVRFCRLWLGDKWMPLSVRFRHARIGPVKVYQKFLGGDVRFDEPMDAIVVARADLDRRVAFGQTSLKPLVRRLLDDIDRVHSEKLAPKVGALLRLTIPSGRANAATVARQLGMTERTFQRRLAEENTSFTRELAAARLQLANDYRSRMTLAELASLLSFSEASAVSRFLNTQTRRSPRTSRPRRARVDLE